jgi:hypothetical protein
MFGIRVANILIKHNNVSRLLCSNTKRYPKLCPPAVSYKNVKPHVSTKKIITHVKTYKYKKETKKTKK